MRYFIENNFQKIRQLFPGILVSVMIAWAALFISEHYNSPVMLIALLLGIALNFLSEEGPCRAGVHFMSRSVLRFGVALLGFRLALGDVFALGGLTFFVVVSGVVLTIMVGVIFARMLRFSTSFGLLTGGAVAICGASAALALSSVLPKSDESERNTLFAVIAVTTLSTAAMIFYPPLVGLLHLNEVQAGIFLGGTIHDVAQVVGAGYSLSEATGDNATLVKLLRVSMLVPVTLALSLYYARAGQRGQSEGQPGFRLPVPLFILGFAFCVALNSWGVVPEKAHSVVVSLSQFCLVSSIAALGVKTSVKHIVDLGWKPLTLVVLQTFFLAAYVLTIVMFF